MEIINLNIIIFSLHVRLTWGTILLMSVMGGRETWW